MSLLYAYKQDLRRYTRNNINFMDIIGINLCIYIKEGAYEPFTTQKKVVKEEL